MSSASNFPKAPRSPRPIASSAVRITVSFLCAMTPPGRRPRSLRVASPRRQGHYHGGVFRLVATDLDGTLLRSSYSVSPRTLEAIRRVQDVGALVVPVTARAPWSVLDVAAEFGIRGYAVCNSGATLYDLGARAVIDHSLLDHGTALRLVSALREAIPHVVFAATRADGYAREEGYVPAVTPPPGHFVGDISEFLTEPVHKLLMKVAGRAPEDLLPTVAAAAGDGLLVGTSGGAFVEVLAAGATKHDCLARLCARLGVEPVEVVAFGDWPNDIGMLRWAGLGVAPANAHADVVAAADDLTATNDEDGVAAYLEGLLGEGRLARA